MNTTKLIAQLTNPVLNGGLGSGAGEDYTGAGTMMAKLIFTLWTTMMTLGALAVMLFFVRGALSWLTAGGDPKKVEDARNTITNAFIGLTLIFAFFAFANFIGPAIGFDLLKLEFPNLFAPNPLS